MENKEEKAYRLTNAVQTLIMKMTEVDSTCADLTEDISKKELSVIDFIADNNEVIMRDVAEYLNVPMSTTTGVIDKLVSKGYVKRYHSIEDRRTVVATLDNKGKETHELLNTMRIKMVDRIMGGLEDGEIDQLTSLLEKVSGNLEQYVV